MCSSAATLATPSGSADTEIHHAVGPQFHGRPAGDDLPLGQLQRRDGAADPTQFAAERRRVGGAEGLPVVLRLRDDDAVDQHTGDLHLSCAQAAGVGDPLHLHDHQAAGVVHRGRHGQRLQGQRLALHGDVPLGIRGGAAQERHVQLQRLVEQVLLAVRG